MTNEQLQERCLEFAGFECYNAKLDIWLKPDGERTTPHLLDYPDFINSVDAHVKWTVPQIAKVASYFEVYYDLEQEPNHYTCVIHLDKGSDRYAHEVTPALAICEAIWELTEKGND